MRKASVFIAFIICAQVSYAASPARLEFYCDDKDTCGTRLISPAAEVRYSERQETEKFHKHNLGIYFSTKSFDKNFPAEIKFGNLSASGSLSRLNSPELSIGSSPLSSGQISTTGLTVSLPGYSSFSKPESSFFQLKLKPAKKKSLSLCVNSWFTPDNPEPVFSALISDKFFSNQLTLNASYTGGRFSYEDNSSASWFLEYPYYHEDSHQCSLFQISADVRNREGKTGFYSGLMGAFYETPFGPYTAVYRADLKLSVKRSDFYSSFYINTYEDTLTSSGKELDPCFQFKSGFLNKKPVITKNTGLLFIKTGLNLFSRINFTDQSHPLKLNAGIQLSTDLFSLSLSASTAAVILSAFPEPRPQKLQATSLSMQLKNSWYLKHCSPAISISAEKKIKETEAELSQPQAQKDDSQLNYKIQLSLSNNGSCKLSGSCTYSFSTKDGEITAKKLTAGFNCRLALKHLTFLGKLSATIE